VTGGGFGGGVSVNFLVGVEVELSDDFFSIGFDDDVVKGGRTDCFSLLFVFDNGFTIEVLIGFFGITVVGFLFVITVSFCIVTGLKNEI
jgi:hypothetical protein